MNKRGIEMSIIEVVGLILAIIILFFLINLGMALWGLFYGGIDQGTVQSFESLVNKIKGLDEKLKEDASYTESHNQYLKDGYILVGFNKGEDVMSYSCGLGRIGYGYHKVERPNQCFKPDKDGKNPACLCLCAEKSGKKPCRPAEKCEIIEDARVFSVTAEEAKHDNNFGVSYSEDDEKPDYKGEQLVLFNNCGGGGKPITFMEIKQSRINKNERDVEVVIK